MDFISQSLMEPFDNSVVVDYPTIDQITDLIYNNKDELILLAA